jgi:hypothetical protein
MMVSSFLADPQVVRVPDPDTVSPGFLGFAVIFVLSLATILLIRSMVGHLRKVRYSAAPEDQGTTTSDSGSA